MARRPASTSRLARALRAGWVGVVLVGYAAALGTTTKAGQGLSLLPHLATDHVGAPPSRPGLVHDDGDHPVLTTLRERETHRHGGRAHSHERPHGGGLEARPLFPERGTVRTGAPDGGLHEHDGVLHRHDAPPPEPAVVLALALDQHDVPATSVVPAPSVRGVDGGLEAPEPSRSVAPSVETPPPIGRG